MKIDSIGGVDRGVDRGFLLKEWESGLWIVIILVDFPLEEPEPEQVQRGLRHWRPVGGGEEEKEEKVCETKVAIF